MKLSVFKDRTKIERRELFRQLSAHEEGLSVFSQPWWLDILCGEDGWDVSLVLDRGDVVVGALPYTFRKGLPLKMILQPNFTPFLDIYIKHSEPNLKHHRSFSQHERILNLLIRQLPNATYFSQIYTMQPENWLPFYWHGYEQTTYYYHYLDLTRTTTDDLWNQFNRKTKRALKKAEEEISVSKFADPAIAFDLLISSCKKQGIPSPISRQKYNELEAALAKREIREIYTARDRKGTPLSVLFVVIDQNIHYALFAGNRYDLPREEAYRLLLWEALKEGLKQGCQFNFCGSILPNIVPVNNGFGATLQPLAKIYKHKNRFWKALHALTLP